METPEIIAVRARLAQEYLDAKRFAESTAKRADELKATLVKDLVDNGVTDDRGHMWCPAGNLQLKRERRVSEVFQTDAATTWAKDNGHWDAVKETIEVLSEDRLLALGWNDQDIANAIKQFYTQKETWAFKVVEQKSYDDE